MIIPDKCEHCGEKLNPMMGVYEHIKHRQKCGAQDYTYPSDMSVIVDSLKDKLKQYETKTE